MCIGVPVQVIEGGECAALCHGRNGEERVNMLPLTAMESEAKAVSPG